MKKFLLATSALVLVSSGALAQYSPGLIGAGHVLGNSTGAAREPTDTGLSALFDQAFCTTNGDVVGRSGGVWTCVAGASAVAGGSNTQVQFNSSSALAGSANLTWVSPALTIGASGTTGQLKLTGSGGNAVTVAGVAATAAYNFNLPAGAGTSGQPLLSGGGGAAAMTFGSLAINQLAAIAADNLIGNPTAGALAPAVMPLVDCTGGGNALNYSVSTHLFSCNIIAGSGTVQIGATGSLAFYGSPTNVVGANTNAVMTAGSLRLGTANTTLGSIVLEGSTSGAVTLTPQATAGTPTLTFGTASGTPVVTASAPLSITTATGNITVTGLAGGVLGGAGPAFTQTPTLGAIGGSTGTVNFAGLTSGIVTLKTQDAAGTWTLKLPTSGGVNGQFLTTDGSGVTTWASVAGSGTVNSATGGQLAYYGTTGPAVSGNVDANISAGALTLGQLNSVIGQVILNGSSSGAVTLTPQAAAGTVTLTLGNTTGTVAAVATAPLAISATTGTVSITGVAGQLLGGAGPAFTATPTLGAAGVATGAVTFAGTTSGTVKLSVADAANAGGSTWTMKLPTATGSNGQFLTTDGSGNTSWTTPAGGVTTLPTFNQVFLSGSGTYTTPANTKWIEVYMVGGGSGGCGGNNVTCTGTGVGGNTTFGTFTAGGGQVATFVTVPGAGGTATNCAPNGVAGSPGLGGTVSQPGVAGGSGGAGGPSPFGGAGTGVYLAAGLNAIANTGSGGAGGGVDTPGLNIGAVGGSAGAYCYNIVINPGATFSYAVGSGGVGGTAGTNGFAAGNGAAGKIIVIEHYGT